MPVYVYRCPCGIEDEMSYPMGIAPEIRCCFSCGNVSLRRVYLPVAVSFKGSGFYKTDSRTKHVKKTVKVGGCQ